jgi:predicted enzyme related to lactoylglutathione lyase
MPNVIMHFEIPADDVERAKNFYTRVFGWTIEPYPMPPGQEYYGVTAKKDGEQGINGGLMKRNMPGQPFTNYVTVESIDRMMPIVQAHGGKFVLGLDRRVHRSREQHDRPPPGRAERSATGDRQGDRHGERAECVVEAAGERREKAGQERREKEGREKERR